MEISYHFSSQLDLVAVWSKLTPNPMTVPCHLSGFFRFPCWHMTWILDKFKSWNCHGICQENYRIFTKFGLISTKLPSKRHEEIHVTFFTCNEQFFCVTWILMEIPCLLRSQIDDSLVQIDTKFHDYFMSFIQVFFLCFILKYDMDFGQVQVMEFP